MKTSDQRGFSTALIISSAAIVAVIAATVVFLILKNKSETGRDNGANQAASTTADNKVNRLPGSEGDNTSINKDDYSLQAEKLTFADFYKKPEEKTEIKNSFNLPINVKTDVVNYYDVARVLTMDKYVDSLNSDAVATIDNPSKDTILNFYGAYDFVAKKSLPLLITSDFILYYYQNSLRDIYNKIQDNIFYSQLWSVNKKMFDIADRRYRSRKLATTGDFDPYLEGAKLEAAYFAVALELLKPKDDQMNTTESTEGGKFSVKAKNEFSFSAPDYISDAVEKEVGLIGKAYRGDVSPIFLYKKDYKIYRIPKDVSDNARLSNFFLAMRWLNSEFPLYYKGDYCPDCLLDKDDWAVNNIAASLIANDFGTNQDIKNQWAKIYKVVSFFQGLRQELSYLQYYDAIVKISGSDYKLEDMFPLDKKVMDENVAKIQAEITKSGFAEIEGGLNRSDVDQRPAIGMRMLQDGYWPDSYIMSQLIYPNVTMYTGLDKVEKVMRENGGSNSTVCYIKSVANRCRATGLDVVNLIYPMVGNEYFDENIKYENYDNQLESLKKQIGNFNITSWHNNGFWSDLNFASTLFYPEQSKILFQAKGWQNKNVNAFLGSWVNLQAAPDKIGNRWQFDSVADLSRGNSYVEPNIDFLNEVIANIEMLKDALTAFRVIKEKDPAMEKIKDVYSDLDKLRNIAKKEIADQPIDYEENKTILTIAEKFQVTSGFDDKRSIVLKSKVDNIGMEENITGIKFFAMVYNLNGRKYMAVGPVFNYRER